MQREANIVARTPEEKRQRIAAITPSNLIQHDHFNCQSVGHQQSVPAPHRMPALNACFCPTGVFDSGHHQIDRRRGSNLLRN